MHSLKLCFVFVLLPALSLAQPKIIVHPESLKTAAKSIGIRFSHMKSPMNFPQSEMDTIDFGSDGSPGKTVTVYLGEDSVQVRNDNFPYEEKHFFSLQLAGRQYVLRLRFNQVFAHFSDDYIRKSRGHNFVEIPETFELANILLMLSPAGQKAGNMVKSGQYYDDVAAYFKPYLGHAVFGKLDFPAGQYMQRYYEFRENSICYNFKGDELIQAEYFFVTGEDNSGYTNAFRDHLELITDFARKSKFREFYKRHLTFYQEQIAKQTEWSDLAGMHKWLEKEFSRPKFDCMKLIFSPVILSSHSTQRFGGFDSNGKNYQQMVMFVSGPDVYNAEAALTNDQRRGLLAGIIFTEMDHNYVNQRTSDFEEAIDSIFSKRELWAPNGNSGFYQSSVSVFNEYFTHALFSLYVLDQYDDATARFLITRREVLMAERRGFVKFREFNAALMKIKKENAETPVSALYPKIIDWCRSFSKR
ncbi:DUF4932 domain-containing protein [Dyadobacter sp. CY261]|uniref:DUF4932 domain-containing protein n=1 Tax=Dyadobacter sp. CY261 TaxID=2907203 RepID=UPI001F369AA3|nr:DUF4932 domain-containing protein [Dyadobacter sp. CY261]MCF0069830.1 DUF4932 domain-containing protein [Dyadobacter sp. CY261]